MSEMSYWKDGKPNTGAESRTGMIRSEDDHADPVVEVEECVRGHELLY